MTLPGVKGSRYENGKPQNCHLTFDGLKLVMKDLKPHHLVVIK